MQKISLDTNPALNLNFELHLSKIESILGLVQISHGMAEHKRRYGEFINYLNMNGFHVVIHDHRGHGDRILNNQIGFFAIDNGWNEVVDDLLAIHIETNKRFPDTPKILLGHSMGSWIAMSALQNNNSFEIALLSGSSRPNPAETFLQKLLLKIEMLRFGNSGYSSTLHKIIFGGFNSKFKNTKTPNDWLSNDSDRVDDYTKDHLCGFVVTNQLWADIIGGIKAVFDPKNLALINKNIPILVFSGSEDPVGGMGKGTKKLHECLKDCECKSELYLVDGARHETLNETNRMTTYNYVLAFIKSNLKGA
ncbi:lysophospholipase [Gammaproteobacteria bacterium]|nr:lysophospholipase [Gammaproteobacteria bacterium]|tara:strand:- start:5475 stop:6395 length:921 start_codon:yes stop_codon:yes gene_type:complete